MNVAPFALQPFSPPPVPLAIQGQVSRTEVLRVSYVVSGDLADVLIPSPAAIPCRRPRLWESTCFELFLAPADAPGYWELNISPSGDWNLYRFAGYRAGMEEEPTGQELPVTVERGAETLALSLNFPGLALMPECVRFGISAVLKHGGGDLSYWALRHVGSQPDFHDPDSFLIKL